MRNRVPNQIELLRSCSFLQVPDGHLQSGWIDQLGRQSSSQSIIKALNGPFDLMDALVADVEEMLPNVEETVLE